MADQRRRSIACPDAPRLDGRRILVTGGNAGIGLATCRGLLERGAEVVMASRNRDEARAACRRLQDETGGSARPVPLDLSDLNSVDGTVAALGNDALDGLVFNAGVWPRAYDVSAQGHELAFATNVLGHHLLFRQLQPRMPKGARVVVLTGDIYITVDDCTHAYRYRGAAGCTRAYARSKLGNLWWTFEAQRRFPAMHLVAVHPGVVASGLTGEVTRTARRLREAVLLTTTEGAQTSLYAITQLDVPPGGYLHNTMGIVELRPDDPARDEGRWRSLWHLCETLCSDHLGHSTF